MPPITLEVFFFNSIISNLYLSMLCISSISWFGQKMDMKHLYRVGLKGLHVFEISLSSAAKEDRPAPLCLSAIFRNIGWKTSTQVKTMKSYPVERAGGSADGKNSSNTSCCECRLGKKVPYAWATHQHKQGARAHCHFWGHDPLKSVGAGAISRLRVSSKTAELLRLLGSFALPVI